MLAANAGRSAWGVKTTSGAGVVYISRSASSAVSWPLAGGDEEVDRGNGGVLYSGAVTCTAKTGTVSVFYFEL